MTSDNYYIGAPPRPARPIITLEDPDLVSRFIYASCIKDPEAVTRHVILYNEFRYFAEVNRFKKIDKARFMAALELFGFFKIGRDVIGLKIKAVE